MLPIHFAIPLVDSKGLVLKNNNKETTEFLGQMVWWLSFGKGNVIKQIITIQRLECFNGDVEEGI